MKIRTRVSLVRGRGLTLGSLFDRVVDMHGDARLFEQAERLPTRETCRSAAALVAVRAGAIRARVGDGERVVIAVPNGYDVVLCCAAAARAGAVPVPVNAGLTDAERDHVVRDSGATLVIDDARVLDGGVESPLPEDVGAGRGDRAVAAIFYTSGTTGKPKGAELTTRGLVGQLGSGALWPAFLRRDEAVVGLPVAHIMGFTVLAGLAVAGVPVYVLPHFRPDDALDAIESRRATMFVGVPAMYRMMLDAGAERRDLRSVRLWGSGADVMPTDLARRFQRMGATLTLPVVGTSVGEAAFVEGYGMVELSGGVATKISPPLVPLPTGNMVGLPVRGNELRVVDEHGRAVRAGQVGELWVRGPGVLAGYHGDEEATHRTVTEDGWVRTGDLARKGPFGAVVFAGRDKDVIKRGGYSVYALEVQRTLEEHEAVAEAAVVGLPDERDGEVPVAAVLLHAGADATAAELSAWCRERLATYKAPAEVRVVERLPRTATGKVRKDEVRALLSND